jgi:hypothetical protein
MEMQFFTFWLTRFETLVTVIGPALVFAAGLALVPDWRRGAKMLALVAVACVPLSHVMSYWDSEGLHVVPVHLAPYLVLMVLGLIDLRTQWFATAFGVWFGSVITDMLTAWTSWGLPGSGAAYTSPAWFWGVGGYGLEDGLLHYPLQFTALLLVGQLALQRRWLRPSTWWPSLASRSE